MKDSDTSEIVIEVLCKHFCSRLPFVYDSFDVDRGFHVSGRHSQCHWRQDHRDVVVCISPSSDTNMVNFHIEYIYVFNFKTYTCVESLILYKINAHCNC